MSVKNNIENMSGQSQYRPILSLYWSAIIFVLALTPLEVFCQSSLYTFFDTGNSGIPSNYVRDIAQEDECTFWFATGLGLAKYDGLEWTVFNTDNSGLPVNVTRNIVIDGHIKWIGTVNGGLARYDDTTWTIYNSSNSGLPTDVILDLEEDAAGNLWIGTTSNPPAFTVGGVTVFDKIDDWTNYNTANSGLLFNNVRSIEVSDTSDIWIGTQEGLSRKVGNNWFSYTIDNSELPYPDVRSLAKDEEGHIWIGTDNQLGDTYGAVSEFDGDNWLSHQAFPFTNSTDVLVDSCQNVWHTSIHIDYFDGSDWVSLDTLDGFPEFTNSIASFYQDQNNRMWIATHAEGVFVISDVCGISTESFCNPVSALDSYPAHGIKVYPNPSSGFLSIETTEGHQIERFRILDSSGRLVLNSEFRNRIDISNLTSGIYILQLENDKMTVSTLRIQIE